MGLICQPGGTDLYRAVTSGRQLKFGPRYCRNLRPTVWEKMMAWRISDIFC